MRIPTDVEIAIFILDRAEATLRIDRAEFCKLDSGEVVVFERATGKTYEITLKEETWRELIETP